jgi:hypothetical protein
MFKKLEATFEEADGYLSVRVRGEWTRDAMRRQIQRIADAARDRAHSRVLVDMRGISAPGSEMDRYHAGLDVAEIWGPRLKVAAVGTPEVYNGFAETVALNRGACLKATTDADEALRWLGSSACWG